VCDCKYVCVLDECELLNLDCLHVCEFLSGCEFFGLYQFLHVCPFSDVSEFLDVCEI